MRTLAVRIVGALLGATAAGSAAQSYAIRVQQAKGVRTITVGGADAAGVMYGGLDVAEAIRTGTLETLADSDHTPHIAKRGIKFNLPLDVRTPTYNWGEWPDSERLNVAEIVPKTSCSGPKTIRLSAAASAFRRS